MFQLDSPSSTGIGKPGRSAVEELRAVHRYDGQKDVIVYYKSSGKLAYEVNGGSLGDAIQFAKVSKASTSTTATSSSSDPDGAKASRRPETERRHAGDM